MSATPPSKRQAKRSQHSLLHSVEEATALIRRCDLGGWAWWLVGTAPFAVGLLHFINDMSRAASASDRLSGSALVLALLYWWMKVAQAIYCDHLLALLKGDQETPPLTLRAKWRLVASQAVIHCTAPWMLVLSFLAMLPFGWAYAAYHNCSVLAASTFRAGGSTRDLVKEALEQSKYSQVQNHGLMLLLLVLSGVVWLNCHIGILLVATIFSAVTGVENEIVRNPLLMLNSGIIATTVMASYVIVGPFVKALYVLRCYYSLARRNGEDLEISFRATSARMLVAIVLLAALPSGVHAQGQSAPTLNTVAKERSKPSLDTSRFEQSIKDVLEQDAFQWRMPREQNGKSGSHSSGKVETFFDDAVTWLKAAKESITHSVTRWYNATIKRWFNRGKTDDTVNGSAGSTTWANTALHTLWALLIVLSLVLVALLIRQWRRLPPVLTRMPPPGPELNLENESVVASQLPENEWLRLAEDKIACGEFRLAMRALFLATLAHLSERKLLAIKKHKSNGDYVQELALRVRGRTELRRGFADSVRIFDWAWYGWHDVTRELLDQFSANHQRIVANDHEG